MKYRLALTNDRINMNETHIEVKNGRIARITCHLSPTEAKKIGESLIEYANGREE